IVDEIRFLGV
ncbi:hypothetical protein AVEN_266896-1, partial [Araneus ventricosus]